MLLALSLESRIYLEFLGDNSMEESEMLADLLHPIALLQFFPRVRRFHAYV